MMILLVLYLSTHIGGQTIFRAGQDDREQLLFLAESQHQMIANGLHDLNCSSEVAVCKMLS